MSLDDVAISRADLVREHYEMVIDADIRRLNLDDAEVCQAMCLAREPLCERGKNCRRSARGVKLERRSSGEHQDNDCASQILAEDRRGNDGDASERIGAHLERGELLQQV